MGKTKKELIAEAAKFAATGASFAAENTGKIKAGVAAGALSVLSNGLTATANNQKQQERVKGATLKMKIEKAKSKMYKPGI